MRRVAVFIDGQSLYSASRAIGMEVDYAKLLPALAPAQQSHLVRAMYYTPVDEDADGYASVVPLTDWLDYNGYCVVTKPGRMSSTRMTVDIAIDAIALAPRLDAMILISGDADLAPAVEAVQRHGVSVTVVSTIKVEGAIADRLRRAADAFVELETLRSAVARPPRVRLAPEA